MQITISVFFGAFKTPVPPGSSAILYIRPKTEISYGTSNISEWRPNHLSDSLHAPYNNRPALIMPDINVTANYTNNYIKTRGSS